MTGLAASVGLSFLALGGVPQQADLGLPYISSSLQSLRDASKVCLSLEGTDELGGRTTTIRTDVFLWTKVASAPESVWLEVVSYENGRISHRMVGNGSSFYQYNVPAREYSVTPYAGLGAKSNSVPLPTVLQLASVHAVGAEVHALRLLNESLLGSVPSMKSWMPGTAPFQILNGQEMKDPLNPAKVYRPRVNETVWLYSQSSKRTIAFWLGLGGYGQDLNYVQWTEKAGTAFTPRMTQWLMTIYRDGDFSLANFRPWTADQTKGWKVQATSRTSG